MAQATPALSNASVRSRHRDRDAGEVGASGMLAGVSQRENHMRDVSGPVASVVIPTHSRPRFLKRAIDSVLSQTYQRLVVFVVDDNDPTSTARTETEEVLAEYADEPRVQYLRHDRNLGGAAARNTGIRATQTEFVAFLDDDDEWMPTKLEKQVVCFARSPASVGLVYTGAKVVDVPAGETYLEMPTLRGTAFPQLLAHNAVGSTSGIAVRRDRLVEVGMFDEQLHASQDYDLYLRLAQVCAFEYVDEPLFVRYKHEGQRLTEGTHNKIEASKRIYGKHAETFRRHPSIRSSYRFKQARLYVRAEKRFDAAAFFLRAYASRPSRIMLLGHAALALFGRRAYDTVADRTRKWRTSA